VSSWGRCPGPRRPSRLRSGCFEEEAEAEEEWLRLRRRGQRLQERRPVLLRHLQQQLGQAAVRGPRRQNLSGGPGRVRSGCSGMRHGRELLPHHEQSEFLRRARWRMPGLHDGSGMRGGVRVRGSLVCLRQHVRRGHRYGRHGLRSGWRLTPTAYARDGPPPHRRQILCVSARLVSACECSSRVYITFRWS
jgi:hypothetical protein